MAQSQTNEYLLRDNGAVVRRTIYEAELDISEQWLQALSKDIEGKCVRAFTLPEIGNVAMTVGCGGSVFYCVNLQRLMIRCPWKLMSGEKYLVPNFSSKTDPLMTMKWVPPSTLRLAFIVAAQPSGTNYIWGGCWLFAVDGKNSMWRLPIANVHDDCSCCTGVQGGKAYPTAHEVLSEMMSNFDNAPYNQDLWRSVELTQSFFMMKPDKENYETITPPGRWTEYCHKVGTMMSKYVLLP